MERRPGGYQCKGGAHGVTDDLLAEGKGGIWTLPKWNWEVKKGPYYPRGGKYYRVK